MRDLPHGDGARSARLNSNHIALDLPGCRRCRRADNSSIRAAKSDSHRGGSNDDALDSNSDLPIPGGAGHFANAATIRRPGKTGRHDFRRAPARR